MGIGEWASQNWFSLQQSVGIIGSLLFTGLTLRLDLKERRTSHELAIAQAHRELWSEFFKRPALCRVLDPSADLVRQAVTYEEEMFILLVIVHLKTALATCKQTAGKPDEALRQDIKWFFSLPTPKAVWERAKFRQEAEFIRFVESCRDYRL